MSRNRNFFPVHDLAQEDFRKVADAFNALRQEEIPAFRASNPLSRLGEKALAVFTSDSHFSAIRTKNEALAITFGFRTFQDFSALADRAPVSEHGIKKAIETMSNSRNGLTLGEQLSKLRRTYEVSLPDTSRHLGHVARQLQLSGERFSEGAGIAYDLEVGARFAAILDT